MEIYFKITFVILWGVYFVARLYFQRQIKGNLEYTRINERQELFLFRIFAIAFMLLPIYSLTDWFNFANILLLQSVRWSGGIITGAGLVLFCWAHQVLGPNWTAVLALSNDHVMIHSGPYRYIRHLMYSAFFIIGIGFGLLSANWLIAIIYLVPLFVMYESRVSLEEKMMIDRFGDSYREYMKYTGRLFPRFWA